MLTYSLIFPSTLHLHSFLSLFLSLSLSLSSFLFRSGMAWMCCDSRKAVRQAAITYLQRALLAHELQGLTALEWFACFKEVRANVCLESS